jgi:hypothetical protein
MPDDRRPADSGQMDVARIGRGEGINWFFGLREGTT